MANFKFSKSEQAIDFLFNSKALNGTDAAFDKWETTYISIKTATGLEMTINTKVLDTGSGTEYTIWEKIKNMVKVFWEQNNMTGMSMDIRFICPQDVKNNIDPNNAFSSFRLSVYSGSGVMMASSSSVEHRIPAPVIPIEAWNKLVGDIFNNWQVEYNKKFK